MLRINELSYWEKKTYFENIDFLVIGSGIVGLSTAIFLKKKYNNSRILVLERGYLPTGASTKNAGFACFGSPTELYDDLLNNDENSVWETFSSRYLGLETLFDLVPKKLIQYNQCMSWDLISSSSKNDISPEFIAYINKKAHEITGDKKIYFEDSSIISKSGFKQISTAYCNKLEGSLNTGLLIQELYRAAIKEDITVLFGIEAKSINRSENGQIIDSAYGEIHAANCIIATNGFAGKWVQEDVVPARAQVIVTNEIPNLKIKGTFHIEKGYYYFRNIDNRVLLGGGRNLSVSEETTEDFGLTDQIQNKLKEMLEQIILPEQEFEIRDAWSGIMGVGKSKKPIIRKIDDHTAIGVRLGGMGVAMGAEVGRSLSKLF